MRFALLLLLLALLGFWWWRRQGGSRPAAMDAGPRRIAQRPSPYHAVAIKTAPYACEQARKLEGKRFLAEEAPRLPLPGCERDNCECRFQHYEDRRSGRDRRSPFASGGVPGGTGSFEQERRRTEGRRADDD